VAQLHILIESSKLDQSMLTINPVFIQRLRLSVLYFMVLEAG
jgi:hypothetical protein